MKLSTITINYNNAIGLEKMIKSIINQTFKYFEYIIIDGKLTDGSKRTIETFAPQISYWVSEPDNGIYNAMNKGINQANGEYLLFINSGDTLYADDVLENVFSQGHNHDIIYGDFQRINPDESTDIVTLPDRVTLPFLLSATICHQVVFIKKDLFQQYGLYREDLKIVSDWAFFLKVFTFDRATQKHIPIVVSNYYMDGLSSLEENQAIIINERNKVIGEDFYTELLDTYHRQNEYRLFYNKSIFTKVRKIKNLIKKILG